MKVEVDLSRCIGCGLCNNICPEVFTIKEEKSYVVGELTNENSESVEEATSSCPVYAITME